MNTHPAHTVRGFTLLELSIVLVIVAVIIATLTVGGDLQRNASYQHLATSFVRGWQLAYLAHFEGTGIVIKDSQTTPTLKVNQGGAEVCGSDLKGAMLAAGVKMPLGRAEGHEDHYAYLDSNGNPQDLEVCFANVDWSVAGATAGAYVVQKKNVMILKRLTPDLARMLDALIDGSPNARFGNFREDTLAASTNAAGAEWSLDNRVVWSEGTFLQPQHLQQHDRHVESLVEQRTGRRVGGAQQQRTGRGGRRRQPADLQLRADPRDQGL